MGGEDRIVAKKRMFTIEVVESDAFTEMPISSQLLYFHLNMVADDDGFINNSRRMAKFIGCSNDDLKNLIAKRFIISFDSGIIVIKHWRLHNSIRSERKKNTQYQDEFKTLIIKENGVYSTFVRQMSDKCQTNVSVDKIRLDKIRLDKISKGGKKKFVPPTLKEVQEYADSRGRGDLAKKFFDWYEVGKWLDKDGKQVQVWKQKFIGWENRNPAPIKSNAQKEIPVVISENAISCPEDVKKKMEEFNRGFGGEK